MPHVASAASAPGRVLGVAFEMVCIALRAEQSDDLVKQAIAAKIIALSRDVPSGPKVLTVAIIGACASPTS
jgi:hypothetical protein